MFVKVDVEECEGVGAKFQVASLPTFVLLKDKKKVDSVSGADKQALEAKILIYYKDASKEDSGVKGMVSAITYLSFTYDAALAMSRRCDKMDSFRAKEEIEKKNALELLFLEKLLSLICSCLFGKWKTQKTESKCRI